MESVGNVTISSITSTSVHIKWIIPKCVDRGSDILSYSCTLSEINTANKIKLETQFNFKLIQIGRLKPFTNYSTVVTITNDIGSGPSSSPIAFRTLEDGKIPYHHHHHHLIQWKIFYAYHIKLIDTCTCITMTIIKFDIVPGPPTIIKLTPLLNTAIVVAFALQLMQMNWLRNTGCPWRRKWHHTK